MRGAALESARRSPAVIGIGHGFGIDVAAKGVETPQQLGFLHGEGEI